MILGYKNPFSISLMPLSFSQIFEQYPPGLVRLMARRKVGTKQVVALTDEEIAVLSGLPLHTVQEIYWAKDWEHISFGHVRRFVAGCQFDPTLSADRNRASAYLRQKGKPSYRYLKQSPLWDTVFRPLARNLK